MLFFWKYEGGEPAGRTDGRTVHLANVVAPEASNETQCLIRYSIEAAPLDDKHEAAATPGAPPYSTSFSNEDAPMRAVVFVDERELRRRPVAPAHGLSDGRNCRE